MEVFRVDRDPWNQEVLVGVSWDLFWPFVVAGALFIAGHMIFAAMTVTAEKGRPSAQGLSETLVRHRLPDRIYHWTMAASVLILLGTAFLPIIGLKFPWVTIHWAAGLVLVVAVGIHIVLVPIRQDWRAMMVWPADIRDAGLSLRRVPRLPGKYPLAQKLYHLAAAVIVLATLVTGLMMMVKVSTPFWTRNPYWLTAGQWGIVHVVHGLAALALITLVMIHVYFALRPDKLWITRSMITGRVERDDFLEHHDPSKWAGESGEGRA